MTVAGDVTFTNPNDAEDHALVLGAADDFMLDGKNITDYARFQSCFGCWGYGSGHYVSLQYHHHYRRKSAAGTLG